MKENTAAVNACVGGIVESETLNECSNVCTKPMGKWGPLVAKIPVVIAEPVIQVDIRSEIRLEEPAFEIKRIKKNVYLTQCKLINTGGCKFGKLFISGFVRKNIEYASISCTGDTAISGDIRHTTVNAPFNCVTKVYYEVPPITAPRGAQEELEFFTNKLVGCDPCAENVIGRDPCEQEFVDYERFNEKIYCELEDVKIFEEDRHMNPRSLGCQFPNEQAFQTLEEKMVLYIRLKLLQRQQVWIPGHEKTKIDGAFDNVDKVDKADKAEEPKKAAQPHNYEDPWVREGFPGNAE